MAIVNAQSFLQQQLLDNDNPMSAIPDGIYQHNSVKLDTQQEAQLSSIINTQLYKANREYGEHRKFFEAKMDTYDFFWSRTIEYAEEIHLPFSPVTYESVGSRGEGLGFLTNDTDTITTITAISACFPSNRIPSGNMLVIETTECHPGYCRLKCPRRNRIDPLVFPPEFFERLNRDTFLRNTFNVSFLDDPGTYNVQPFENSVHGPALTNETVHQDVVIAIRCEQPHDLLNTYLSRRRTWPDSSVLDKIRDSPCVVVSVSHPMSAKPSLEFRISFASVEKILIRNFSDYQFACYGFLKIIKRRIESENPELKAVLKSYYIKTALLWISEQVETCSWTEHNFLYFTSICLSYLQQCLRSRNLPQLFLPANNLIDHLRHEVCDKMADALKKYIPPVNARVFLASWCDDTFDQRFDLILARPRRTLKKDIAELFLKSSISNVIISSISHLVESSGMSFYLLGCKVSAGSVVCQVLYQMIIRDLDNILKPDMAACMKTLLYRLLADIMHRQPRFVRNNNKLAMEFYKKSLTLVYPVTGFDDQELSGKTCLALFHYLNRDYKDAMAVLNDVEHTLNQADINRAVLIHFVDEDLQRFWCDPFLTKMIKTFCGELRTLPVKCNALAFYIYTRCMDELQHRGDICLQQARLTKLKRSVVVNEIRLSALENFYRLYTGLLLDAAKTVVTELLTKHSIP